jgi:hypothetical protein
MQKGGIVFYPGSVDERGSILENEEAAFHYFLRNSYINFVSKGATGLIFTCIFNTRRGVVSPFLNFRGPTFITRANTIVMKLCLLGDSRAPEFSLFLPGTIPNPMTRYLTEEDFANELQIFRDIYTATNQYLEPICPTPLYSAVLTAEEYLHLESSFQASHSRATTNLFRMISQHVQTRNTSVALLAMESAAIEQGFDTMSPIMRSVGTDINGKTQLTALACYELLELGKAGYTQGDYHFGNFLISGTTSQYFDPSLLPASKHMKWCGKTRCFIIDFGRAVEFETERKEQFNRALIDFLACPPDNPSAALLNCMQIIWDAGIFYEGRKRDQFNKPQYNWILDTNYITPLVASVVQDLFAARETQIIKTTESMNGLIERSLNTLRRSRESVSELQPMWSLDFIVSCMKLYNDAAVAATIVPSLSLTLELPVEEETKESAKESAKEEVITKSPELEEVVAKAASIAPKDELLSEVLLSVGVVQAAQSADKKPSAGSKLIAELSSKPVSHPGAPVVEGSLNIEFGEEQLVRAASQSLSSEDEDILAARIPLDSESPQFGGMHVTRIRPRLMKKSNFGTALNSFNSELNSFLNIILPMSTEQLTLLTPQSFFVPLFIVTLKFVESNSYVIQTAGTKSPKEKKGLTNELNTLLNFFMNMNNGYNSIRDTLTKIQSSNKKNQNSLARGLHRRRTNKVTKKGRKSRKKRQSHRT